MPSPRLLQEPVLAAELAARISSLCGAAVDAVAPCGNRAVLISAAAVVVRVKFS